MTPETTTQNCPAEPDSTHHLVPTNARVAVMCGLTEKELRGVK